MQELPERVHCEMNRVIFLISREFISKTILWKLSRINEKSVERNRKMGQMSWGISSNAAIYILLIPIFDSHVNLHWASASDFYFFFRILSQISAFLIIVWKQWGRVDYWSKGSNSNAKWNASECFGHSNLRSKARAPFVGLHLSMVLSIITFVRFRTRFWLKCSKAFISVQKNKKKTGRSVFREKLRKW